MIRIFALITLLLSLSLSIPTTEAQSVVHLFPVGGDYPPIPVGINVGVYYYPWHGDDFHRNDGYLRDLLEPKHQPTLGEYDDRKPEVIAQHLAWSRQANVKLWVCSWWGPNSREDNTIRDNILPHADLGDHKIALLYETTGRVKENEGYDPSIRVADDMAHICKTYFDDEHYQTIDGRPVIVMYLTRVLGDKNMPNGETVLAATTRILRETARTECNTEVYLVGDQVWRSAPGANANYDAFNHLDAVTNYDIYGNSNNPPYAGIETVNNYYNQQADWLAAANAKGVNYIPAVSPGYNDRGVRLERDHIGLSRRLTADDEPGSLFVAQLLRARYLIDQGADSLLLVNSFNEWHEDSQIEPTIGEPTTKPELYTNGIEYEGYEELYLNILRVATCDSNCPPLEKWRSIALQEDPFDGPPPNNILVGAYYQAWHGDDFRAPLQFLRGELENQGPELGLYKDTDPFTIQEHVKYSHKANIGLWIASFDGRFRESDNALRLNILPEMGDIKLALFYEVQLRIDKSQGYNLDKVKLDIQHMCEKYFGHVRYFTSHGRPVVFVKITRKWYAEGILESIVEMMRSTASADGYELYIVGDQVWGSAPYEDLYLPFFSLDAVTNVDVYGNMGASGYAGQKAVDKYYNRQRDWRDRAWNSNCGFIPAVTTGFNNRALGNALSALSRKLEEDDTEGSLIAESLRQARYLVDSDLSNLLLINSFNNWFEDSQIEPTVGTPQSTPVSLTEGFTYKGYGDLYLNIVNEATKDLPMVRSIQSPAAFPKFYPLRCNIVNFLSTTPCEETWSQVIGTADIYEEEVLIPCGRCIILDHPSQLLKLNGGIDIQGKLRIPDQYEIEIQTPYIRVQGELEIKSLDEIGRQPKIKISMIDGEPGIEKFQAASSNGYACGVQRCQPGPRSIFVVGGRVDIQGIPDDAPTWLQLVDVVTASSEPPFRRDKQCPPDGVNIIDSFEDEDSSSFRPTLGATVTFEDYSLVVKERTSAYHGVQLDLSEVAGCMLPGETYTVTFEIRVNRPGFEDVLVDCASIGENCIKIFSDLLGPGASQIQSTLKYQAPPSAFTYGNWMYVEESFTFDDAELDRQNAFLSLRVGGGEVGADLELRNFKMQMDADSACEASDCYDLVQCNGNAEYGIFPSPFSRRGNAQLKVEVEDGNQFWQVTREESTANDDGMEWNVPTDCMTENAVYKFRMRIRVHADSPSESAVYIRTESDIETSTQQVLVCPKSSGSWVWCEGFYEIPESSDGILEVVTIYFVTEGIATATYDVDDLSFTFVHMDGPVTGLVVADTVQGKWGVGSSILVTSHTIDWRDQYVRSIKSIKNHTDGGLVILELNEDIPRPASLQSSDFPIEVALLSRNIVFLDGSGLTIYHTPEVEQHIVGAKFKGFGEQGETSRYPIHFHEVTDSPGSVISKNAITQSKQGCIVLSGTNDVVVEDNIAYDTAGHCYVLENGVEERNTLRRNLGAHTRHSATVKDPLHTGFEHVLDSSPATFLISNPNNIIEGNVASGSQGEGFAVILERQSGRPQGSYSLEHFLDNVAHSNKVRGFHITMGSTYRSSSAQFKLEGLKSYRNAGPGLLIADSENVIVERGSFCDNRGNVEIGRSQRVTVNNTQMIGYSEEIMILESTQSSTLKLCNDRQVILSGIRMDSFTRNRQSDGLILENTSFQGFSGVRVCKEHVLAVDSASGWGPFDFFTTLSGVDIESDARRVDLCPAFRNLVRDVYMIDTDSSLKPAESTATSSSSIVSDGSKALDFLPANRCTHVPEFCYHYCEDTCLRTVIFSIDPAIDQQPKLMICVRGGSATECQEYVGTTYYEPIAGQPSSFVQRGLYYYVTLPKGRYEAHFFEYATSTRVWPTFVETSYTESLCVDALVDHSIWIPPPPVPESQCSNLLQNGDAEGSSIDDAPLAGWIGGHAGMKLVTPPGWGNNNATTSNTICDIDSVLAASSSTNMLYSFGQYLDTRCLLEGNVFQLNASIRWYNSKTQEPGMMKCTDEAGDCPQWGIAFLSNDGYSWMHEFRVATALQQSNDNIFSNGNNNDAEASSLFETTHTSTGSTTSKLVVDAEMASASSAFVYVDRNNYVNENIRFCMAEVSLTRISS